jgi:hypothetical protein
MKYFTSHASAQAVLQGCFTTPTCKKRSRCSRRRVAESCVENPFLHRVTCFFLCLFHKTHKSFHVDKMSTQSKPAKSRADIARGGSHSNSARVTTEYTLPPPSLAASKNVGVSRLQPQRIQPLDGNVMVRRKPSSHVTLNETVLYRICVIFLLIVGITALGVAAGGVWRLADHINK